MTTTSSVPSWDLRTATLSALRDVTKSSPSLTTDGVRAADPCTKGRDIVLAAARVRSEDPDCHYSGVALEPGYRGRRAPPPLVWKAIFISPERLPLWFATQIVPLARTFWPPQAGSELGGLSLTGGAACSIASRFSPNAGTYGAPVSKSLLVSARSTLL
jgi:hypothetical protein